MQSYSTVRQKPLAALRTRPEISTIPHPSAVRCSTSHETQRRSIPHHPHRQPAAAAGSRGHDVREGRGRAGGVGSARQQNSRRSRRGRAEAARRRRRYRERRRDVQAELRHVYQGPAGRIRRHGQHVRVPGSGRFPGSRTARVQRSRTLAAQDARHATRPSRSAMSTAVRHDVENLKAAVAGSTPQKCL